MKVLSIDGLTKLIQLIKNSFISVDDTVTTNTATLATVATSGSYNDLSDKPIIATSVSASSTNAETVGAKLFYDTYNDFGEQLATKTDMLQATKASMPSDKYIDLTLGASGSTYTAPADGYYRLTMKQSAAEQYAYLASYTPNDEPILSTTSKTATGKDSLSTWIAVHKGQKVKAVYNAPEKRVFRFIYAEGSK